MRYILWSLFVSNVLESREHNCKLWDENTTVLYVRTHKNKYLEGVAHDQSNQIDHKENSLGHCLQVFQENVVSEVTIFQVNSLMQLCQTFILFKGNWYCFTLISNTFSCEDVFIYLKQDNLEIIKRNDFQFITSLKVTSREERNLIQVSNIFLLGNQI